MGCYVIFTERPKLVDEASLRATQSEEGKWRREKVSHHALRELDGARQALEALQAHPEWWYDERSDADILNPRFSSFAAYLHVPVLVADEQSIIGTR